MKKVIYTLLIAFVLVSGLFTGRAVSQTDTNNVLLEYCTGTWCQWCPCAHAIIRDAILVAYPNTVILAYHGAGTDPWISYSSAMISAFGFSSYPTGVVGRTTGIINRGSWFSQISYQATFEPGVRIDISNKTYNTSTRLMSATVNITALHNLPPSDYRIMFVITEDNLVYPQTGNSSCIGGTNYIHNHVVKAVINAPFGDSLTSQAWDSLATISTQFSFTLPSHILYSNANLNTVVYMNGVPLSSGAPVQNAKRHSLNEFTTIGITSLNETLTGFQLNQNYPNPFNPSTNIRFNVPKDGHASLKIYDIRGNQVAVYLDQDIKAGSYSVDFDGSNLPSGVYFYKLTAGNFSDTKKMMLVK